MTRFLTDYDRGFNIDHIRRISINKTSARVFFDNDEEECFPSGTSMYSALRNFLNNQDDHNIVPATPGYELVTFVAPDSDSDPDRFDIASNLSRSPVIAWQVSTDAFSNQLAIAIDGTSNGYSGHSFGRSGVLTPSVAVFVDDCSHASLEAWIEDIRVDWKAARVNARRAGLRVIGGTVVAVTSTVRT